MYLLDFTSTSLGLLYSQHPTNNQSVENAGVAFVKEANEKNEFFERITKR